MNFLERPDLRKHRLNELESVSKGIKNPYYGIGKNYLDTSRGSPRQKVDLENHYRGKTEKDLSSILDTFNNAAKPVKNTPSSSYSPFRQDAENHRKQAESRIRMSPTPKPSSGVWGTIRNFFGFQHGGHIKTMKQCKGMSKTDCFRSHFK